MRPKKIFLHNEKKTRENKKIARKTLRYINRKEQRTQRRRKEIFKRTYQNLPASIIHLQAEEYFPALQTISIRLRIILCVVFLAIFAACAVGKLCGESD